MRRPFFAQAAVRTAGLAQPPPVVIRLRGSQHRSRSFVLRTSLKGRTRVYECRASASLEESLHNQQGAGGSRSLNQLEK